MVSVTTWTTRVAPLRKVLDDRCCPSRVESSGVSKCRMVREGQSCPLRSSSCWSVDTRLLASPPLESILSYRRVNSASRFCHTPLRVGGSQTTRSPCLPAYACGAWSQASCNDGGRHAARLDRCPATVYSSSTTSKAISSGTINAQSSRRHARDVHVLSQPVSLTADELQSPSPASSSQKDGERHLKCRGRSGVVTFGRSPGRSGIVIFEPTAKQDQQAFDGELLSQSLTKAGGQSTDIEERLRSGWWFWGPLLMLVSITLSLSSSSIVMWAFGVAMSELAGSVLSDFTFLGVCSLLFRVSLRRGLHRVTSGWVSSWAGPWERDGLPRGAKVVAGFFAGLALVLPLGVWLYAMQSGLGQVAAAVLAPYFALLGAEVAAVMWASRQGLPLTPVVSIVLQAYRILQIMRGAAIIQLNYESLAPALTKSAQMEELVLKDVLTVLFRTMQALNTLWVFSLTAIILSLPWLYSDWREDKEAAVQGA
eukprot:TRINITY_DN5246_c0_g1_i2.p1 TRINITY_DN5246_c0_g1~~TRINITY_DN5246_c0_g1_i2.p1  ORF type:complete len:481 (-),score=50.56 TRINITY_DN5246_c0_g1_i2:218-1660(-)